MDFLSFLVNNVVEWSSWDKKGNNIMYHFVEDKDFLKRMNNLCSGIINQLVQMINNEGLLEVEAHLVGSGARNLVTQNANKPIDLDYNLCIIDSIKFNINDCKNIKEYVRKSFNKVLKRKGLADCQDSKSALTTEQIRFKTNNKTLFSIDLCIVTEDENGWQRLIHKKTGIIQTDEWIWNKGRNSQGLIEKVEWLKDNNLWTKVREVYLNKKNMYLVKNDYDHPSFICYIEAVNQVYDEMRQKKFIK